MKLINTDGMTFIGLGSEWFWTALSGVVLTVTFLAIYRQLRIARDASVFQQLEASQRELTSERMLRYQLDVYVAIRDGVDPGALPLAAVNALGNFWEKYALLARHGHLNPRLLWKEYGNLIPLWWSTLAAMARRFRAEDNDPTIFEDFEWLAERLADMNRRAGYPAFDASTWASTLPDRIVSTQDRLQVEQALRTFTLAPPELGIVKEPASTAPSGASA